MSKNFAVGELGPFSSTSVHQAFPAGVDAHVIRDEVDDVAEAVCGDGLDEGSMCGGSAKLRIDLVVVEDVVAVSASGRGREVRRRVTGPHTQSGQVGDDTGRR